MCAAVAGMALYLFVAHSATADRPFLNPQLLTDRNYALGLVIVFVFGMLNFTLTTLLPPLLQGVRGYPDSVIGLVLGARGVGTLLGFFLIVWANRFDPRVLLNLVFACPAYRSEEHTSETQSTIRHSEAVFSLQKKKKFK